MTADKQIANKDQTVESELIDDGFTTCKFCRCKTINHVIYYEKNFDRFEDHLGEMFYYCTPECLIKDLNKERLSLIYKIKRRLLKWI